MKSRRGSQKDSDETRPAIDAGGSHSSDDNEHFEAEEHDDEEHDEHIDEKWLVSYSDMMTLLFGLFVMLYSMAIDKKGNFEEQLKSMATQNFTQTESQIPAVPVAAAQPTPPPVATPRPEVALQEQLEKIKIEKDAVAMELAELRRQRDVQKEREQSVQTELAEAKSALTASLAKQAKIAKLAKPPKFVAEKPKPTPVPKPDRSPELEKKIAELEKDLKAATKKDPTLDKKIAKLEDKNIKLEEANKKLEEFKAQIQAQNKELESKVKTATRTIASVDTKTETLDTQLKQSEQQREVAQADLDKVQKKLAETQEKLQRLEKFEEQEKNKKPFLMFVVKWATEKVDVDMVVTDPAGHRFNFKKRKFAGAPGEFTLDSRAGPGAEIWQADGFQAGVYTVEVTLYQTYGNDEPAVIELSIASTLKRLKLPSFKLTATGKRSSTFKVNVNEAGEMTLR